LVSPHQGSTGFKGELSQDGLKRARGARNRKMKKMTISENPDDAHKKNAADRYAKAIEKHHDKMRRPLTPAKVSWDILRRRCAGYIAYVHSIDRAWNDLALRGMTPAALKMSQASIGEPMSMEDWLKDSSVEVDFDTRGKLESEILVAPDGSEYCAFYLGCILMKQPIRTKNFEIMWTIPEEPYHDIALIEEKVGEDSQASVFLRNYKRSSEWEG